MSGRRTSYTNPRPYKTTTVSAFCDHSTKVHGVLFECSGNHGPKSKHRVLVKDDFGRFVWVEWAA